MTATETIQQFIARNGLLLTATPATHNPSIDESTNMDHWACKIANLSDSRAYMHTVFSQGHGHRKGGQPTPPTLADVLDCLASDSASVENAQSFDDWCADFGYDTDSRKAERTYNACKGQAAALRTLLGDTEYDTMLWSVERL